MFASILPAFRHVRTPIVVGWLYAILAWILLSPLPTIDRHNEFVDRLFHLSDLVGGAATMVALSFAIYLLGTFLVVRRWPIGGRMVEWLESTRPGWGNDRDSTVDESPTNEFGELPRPPLWWRLISTVVYFRWDTSAPLVMEPIWPYERADGLGTAMTVRTTAPWASAIGDWANQVSERYDHAFTYTDLRAVTGHTSDFMLKLEEEWEIGRKFLFERANNELVYKREEAAGGIRWIEDPEFPGSRMQSIVEPYEITPDELESRHRPPWDASADGWEENPQHPWWEFEENSDETVKDRYLREALLASLDDELEFVVTRLRVEGSRVFDEYDRKQSEAELRYSITPPLLALIVVSAILWNPLASVAIIVPIALLRQGFLSEREALTDVFAALRYGVVTSPTVEQFEHARARNDAQK